MSRLRLSTKVRRSHAAVTLLPRSHHAPTTLLPRSCNACTAERTSTITDH